MKVVSQPLHQKSDISLAVGWIPAFAGMTAEGAPEYLQVHVFALRLWGLFGAIRRHIQAFTLTDGWIPAFAGMTAGKAANDGREGLE